MRPALGLGQTPLGASSWAEAVETLELRLERHLWSRWWWWWCGKIYDVEEEDNFYLCGIEVEILLGYLRLQAKKPLHPQDVSRKLFLTKVWTNTDSKALFTNLISGWDFGLNQIYIILQLFDCKTYEGRNRRLCGFELRSLIRSSSSSSSS